MVRYRGAAYPELHPESPTLDSELRHFKTKVDAGANGAITQYFYASDAYFRFRDECLAQGIDIPITPGIMPITNLAGIKRFSAVCGADIPRWILRRLESLEDDSDSLKPLARKWSHRFASNSSRGVLAFTFIPESVQTNPAPLQEPWVLSNTFPASLSISLCRSAERSICPPIRPITSSACSVSGMTTP